VQYVSQEKADKIMEPYRAELEIFKAQIDNRGRFPDEETRLKAMLLIRELNQKGVTMMQASKAIGWATSTAYQRWEYSQGRAAAKTGPKKKYELGCPVETRPYLQTYEVSEAPPRIEAMHVNGAPKGRVVVILADSDGMAQAMRSIKDFLSQ